MLRDADRTRSLTTSTELDVLRPLGLGGASRRHMPLGAIGGRVRAGHQPAPRPCPDRPRWSWWSPAALRLGENHGGMLCSACSLAHDVDVRPSLVDLPGRLACVPSAGVGDQASPPTPAAPLLPGPSTSDTSSRFRRSSCAPALHAHLGARAVRRPDRLRPKLTTSAARRSSSRWTSSVNPIRFPVWKPRSDEDDRLFGRTGPSRWGRSDARAGCRGPESIAIAPRRGPATTTSAPAGCRSSFLQ